MRRRLRHGIGSSHELSENLPPPIRRTHGEPSRDRDPLANAQAEIEANLRQRLRYTTPEQRVERYRQRSIEDVKVQRGPRELE
jgi:hypothetical protein